MSTASTLLNRAWKLLRTDGSTTDVPGLQEAGMLEALDTVNKEWRRTFRRASGEPPLPIRKETGFDLVADTALAEDVTTSETDWDVDSASNLDDAGVLVIWDDGMPDTIEYTSKASNTLSGVSGAAFAHEDNDAVQKLYALPSDFSEPRSTEDNPGGLLVNDIPFFYTSGTPTGDRFAIYDNGTSKYLWLPRGLSGSAFLLYNKNSTTIDDTTDGVDWDDDYDLFGIYRLVEHGMISRGDPLANAQLFQQKADAVLLQAQQEKSIGKIIRTRPINTFRSNSSALQLLTQRDS